MKVLTKYPVYINRKKVSNADFYMNADAAIIKNSVGRIKAFQDWLDAKGIKWVGATDAELNNGKLLNKGSGYGTFGPSTVKAWDKYGDSFVATAQTMTNILTGMPTTPSAPVVTTTTTTTEPTPQQKEEAAKRGLQWDKVKGWIQIGQQTGIIDSVLGLFGVQPQPVVTGSEGGTIPGGSVTTPGGSVVVTTPEEEKRKKRNRMLLIGGGVLAVVVIGYFIFRSKKTTESAPAQPTK